METARHLVGATGESNIVQYRTQSYISHHPVKPEFSHQHILQSRLNNDLKQSFSLPSNFLPSLSSSLPESFHSPPVHQRFVQSLTTLRLPFLPKDLSLSWIQEEMLYVRTPTCSSGEAYVGQEMKTVTFIKKPVCWTLSIREQMKSGFKTVFIECGTVKDANKLKRHIETNFPKVKVFPQLGVEKDLKNLYVSNLPSPHQPQQSLVGVFRQETFVKIFTHFGRVVSAKLLSVEPDQQMSTTGCPASAVGFVRFQRREEARWALSEMNRCHLVLHSNGRPVECRYANRTHHPQSELRPLTVATTSVPVPLTLPPLNRTDFTELSIVTSSPRLENQAAVQAPIQVAVHTSEVQVPIFSQGVDQAHFHSNQAVQPMSAGSWTLMPLNSASGLPMFTTSNGNSCWSPQQTLHSPTLITWLPSAMPSPTLFPSAELNSPNFSAPPNFTMMFQPLYSPFCY